MQWMTGGWSIRRSLGSTRTRAREVRGEVLGWAGAASALERRGEAADIGAERGAGLVGFAGLPAARDQQRPALHLAAAVSHRRADRVCAGEVAPPVEQLATGRAPIDPIRLTGEADRPTGGMIEVELPSGVKLRLTGAVDEAALRQVLSALS